MSQKKGAIYRYAINASMAIIMIIFIIGFLFIRSHVSGRAHNNHTVTRVKVLFAGNWIKCYYAQSFVLS